jgi:hypothetical protein
MPGNLARSLAVFQLEPRTRSAAHSCPKIWISRDRRVSEGKRWISSPIRAVSDWRARDSQPHPETCPSTSLEIVQRCATYRFGDQDGQPEPHSLHIP